MRNCIRFGETLNGRPFERDRTQLDGTHGLLRGRTGSGKSLLMTQLEEQMTEDYERDSQRCRDPVFINDGSGDLFSYHTIRKAARRYGRQFMTLSLNPSVSDFFDPMQVCRYLGFHSLQMAAFLCAGLGLLHGMTYGKSYYGRLNQHDFVDALERLGAKGTKQPTIWDIGHEMRLMLKETRSRELSEAVLAVDSLLFYPQLLPSSDPDRNIDLARALDECWVIYAFLPTLREPQPARVMQALFSWASVFAALHRVESGLPFRWLRFFHDEFATTVGSKSLEDVLTLSRKAGVHWHGAFQDSQLLVTTEGDIGPTVRTNTAWKVYFDSSSADDDEELMHYSKTQIVEMTGRSTHGYSATYSTRQVVEPILQVNEIRDVSSTRFHAFFIDQLGNGHIEPEHIVCRPTTSQADYDRLKNLPLPIRPPSTTTTTTAGVNPAASAGQATRRAAIASVISAIRSKWIWRQP